jgi:hypothetical protein
VLYLFEPLLIADATVGRLDRQLGIKSPFPSMP